MTTTAIFAELLVIGLLTESWLALILAAKWGVPPLDSFKGWEALVTVALLALAYLLGIPTDRIADSITDRWDDTIANRFRHSNTNGIDREEMRLRLLKAPPPAIQFLDYARSRRRITRAAALDGAIAAIVSGALLFGQSKRWPIHVSADLVIVTLAVSLLVGAGGAFAWWRIGRMYYERLSQAYLIYVDEVPAPLPPSDTTAPRRVAPTQTPPVPQS
jgi:hypothetical protein